jgi:hypothetical protein
MKAEEMKWTKEARDAFNTFSEKYMHGNQKEALAIINDLFEKEGGIAEIGRIGRFYISKGVVMFEQERRRNPNSGRLLLLH